MKYTRCLAACVYVNIYIYIYVHIYIESERDMYIYVYMYTLYTHGIFEANMQFFVRPYSEPNEAPHVEQPLFEGRR